MIYTVEFENEGYPEDRTNNLIFAGLAKKEALKAANNAGFGTITLSIWRDGKQLSCYSFARWEGGRDKWEHQAGEKQDWIEALNQEQ